MTQCGMRNAECGMFFGHSALRTPHSALGRRAQASLEMTAALIGALLLLFGSLKVCLYFAERIVKRHQNYEYESLLNNRVAAANTVVFMPPILPTEPQNKLNIFTGDD